MAERVLGERYELIEPIGIGGMATVWRAIDRRLDRFVAVKVLSEASSDSSFLQRQTREARIAASLTHLNIVTVHDSGIDGSEAFIVMELVEGMDLHKMLSEQGALGLHRSVALIRQALAGISHAHSRGIVHRDIKPANLLVTTGGTVKVADFGIAHRAVDPRITATGTLFGTPNYLAPEQARGEEPNERSDIYAIGCVLFECLTGRPVFSATSPMGLALKHQQDGAPPLSIFLPGAPAAIEGALACALEKDPLCRFASAREFDSALAGIQEETGSRVAGGFEPSSPITSRLPSSEALTEIIDSHHSEARRAYPRHRQAWLAVGTVILSLAIGTVLWALFTPRLPRETKKAVLPSATPSPTPTISSASESSVAALADPLSQRSPEGHDYTVKLPGSWRFRDATTPSDHSTHLWSNPNDALSKMQVVFSGCVGCAEDMNTGAPNPDALLPPNTVSHVRLNKWATAFEAYDTDDPYPNNGLIIVLRDSTGAVAGYASVNLWLPETSHALATTILNSFKVTATY